MNTKVGGQMKFKLIVGITVIVLLLAAGFFVNFNHAFACGIEDMPLLDGGAGCGYGGGYGNGGGTTTGSTTTTTTTTTTTSTSGHGEGGGGGGGHCNDYVTGVGCQPPDAAYSVDTGHTDAHGNHICISASTNAGVFGGTFLCKGSSKTKKKTVTTTTTTIYYICNNVIVSSADVECDHSGDWSIQAFAPWPGIPIDTRPYPATLNRYPTFLRVESLPTSVGSASLSYVPMGGGSPGKPRKGDWRNITVTVQLYPDPGVLPQVYLEDIGWIFPPIGQLYQFTWQLPSHPDAGGNVTAGAVGQLQELPQDMPVYTNQARAAYLASCTLSYQEADEVCVKGPDSTGNTDCDNNTGHTVLEWVNKSETQDLSVSKSKVPANQMADTNGDGIPDAYWDLGVTVLRMNDANSVSDPVYAHSYSWGDVFYWAVREAQGQITFP